MTRNPIQNQKRDRDPGGRGGRGREGSGRLKRSRIFVGKFELKR